MAPTRPSRIDPTDVLERGRGSFVLAVRSGLYTLLILAVALGAGAYSLREYSIFNCPASGYGSDVYLGYCGATSYGDYDHGSILFVLEPPAVEAATNAHVVFLCD